MAAGKTIGIPVNLTNIGTETWMAGGTNPYKLGALMYDQNGNVVADVRTALPANVPAGGSISLYAQIQAPSTAGTYTLKWNMVEEGVAWFSDKGAPTTNYTVSVTNPGQSSNLGLEDFWGYHDFSIAGLKGNLNVANGNLVLKDSDFSLSGRGVPIEVSRYYNSQSTSSGLFGPSWRASFEQNIAVVDSNKLLYTDESGASRLYIKNASGGYTAPTGVFSELKINANYNPSAPNPPDTSPYPINNCAYDNVNWKYRIKETSGERSYFDGSGRLIRMVDGKNAGVEVLQSDGTYDYDANRTIFTYDSSGILNSITDASNRSAAITTQGGKITQITFSPTTINYVYDALGRLITVTVSKGTSGGNKTSTTTYNYNDPNNLNIITGIVDGNGKSAYLSFNSSQQLTAYRDERSTSSTDTVYETDFSYDPQNLAATVTDPKGKLIKYNYNGNGNRTKTTLDPNGIAEATSYTYNSINQLSQLVDSKGTTSYYYDGYGNTVKVDDSLSQNSTATVQAAYNTSSVAPANPNSVTDANSKQSIQDYDKAGNLTSANQPLSNGSFIGYDINKNPVNETFLPRNSTNLIKNPSFEAGTTNWNGPGPANNAVITTSQSRFGNQSLLAQATSMNVERWSDLTPIKANTAYSRSIYVRGSGYLFTAEYDSGKNKINTGDHQQAFSTGTSWRRIALTFTSASNASYFSVGLRAVPSNTAYFDGVQLEESSVVSTYNLTENSGFENGVSKWTLEYPAGVTTFNWWSNSIANWSNLKYLSGDFNGDGKSDILIYDSSIAQWNVYLSTGSGFAYGWSVSWGNSGGGDTPLVGDFNGDGKTDIAIYRTTLPYPNVYVNLSSGSTFTGTAFSASWGDNSDQPIVGDFNGDGKADLGLRRPSTGSWYFNYMNSSGTGFSGGGPSISWGDPGTGDIPYAGDFNGDSKTDLMIYRPAANGWYINLSTGSGFSGTSWTATWGDSSAISTTPVIADVNGDGKSDIIGFCGYSGGESKAWDLTSTGSAFNGASQWWDSGAGNWDAGATKLTSADYNGDGQGDLDVLYNYGYLGTKAWVFLSNGSTNHSVKNSGASSYWINLPEMYTASSYQTYAVKPNTTYLVSGWVYSDNVTVPGFFHYQVDETPSGNQAQLFPTESFSNWIRASGVFTTSATAASVKLSLAATANPNNSSNYYFDDIQLIEAPPGTSNTYDAGGNYPVSATDQLKYTSYSSYDALGNLNQFRDARSASSSDNTYLTGYAYDNEQNLLTQVTDPLSKSTYYDYDANGNLTAVRDARSANSSDTTYLTANDYYENNLLKKVTDPLGYVTNYAYDGAGNETTITQPNGNIVSKTYDGASRLYQLLYNGILNYTFGYDTAGNETTVTSAGGQTWTGGYDKASRLTTDKDSANYSSFYGYDKNSNVTTLTVGGTGLSVGGVTYNYIYNDNNWLRSINTPQGLTNIASDDRGDRLSLEHPANAPKTYYQYDDKNEISDISNQNTAGALLSEYSYGYDKVGNIATETVTTGTAQTTTYSYDPLNRLSVWYNPSGGANKYTKYLYDAAGNVTGVKQSPDNSNWTDLKTFTFDNAGQLSTETIGGSNYPHQYDQNGNQTQDSVYKYTYDAENRLTAVNRASDNSSVAAYGYDYRGRRISKWDGTNTTYFHYDKNNNVVADTDSSGTVTATYAYLPGDYKPILMTKYSGGSPTGTYYYQRNARGDVVSMTDASSNIVAKWTYDPWGAPKEYNATGQQVPVGTAGNPYLYASYRYDTETNLYYLLARYYDPNTYRFLTRDPDGGDKDRPLSQNPYAYGEDNPVNKVDPDGNNGLALALGGLAGFGEADFWNPLGWVALGLVAIGTAYYYRHEIARAARHWYHAATRHFVDHKSRKAAKEAARAGRGRGRIRPERHKGQSSRGQWPHYHDRNNRNVHHRFRN